MTRTTAFSSWNLFFIVGFFIVVTAKTEEDASGSLIPVDEGNNGEGDNNNGTKKLKTGELYLPEDYNKYEIPDAGAELGLEGALIVRVHVTIREIQDLDELDGKITVVMDVRLWWTDWQIFTANQKKINPSGDGIVIEIRRRRDIDKKNKKLDPSFLQKIWKPDLFMESLTETSRPEFIAKPIKLVYRSDGTMILQTRITVTLSCNMDFVYYPADSQECPFRIRSYSFESDEMELEWGEPKPSIYAFDRTNTNFEVQVTEPLLEQLIEPSLDFDPLTFWGGNPPRKNDTFLVLKFSIKARRKMSYHMIQTYIPSVFFIAITWLCFFIPPTMVECRIGITMTTLLTLTAMFAAVREGSPSVSYCKAIDIWMIACVAFVFSCLVEFALLVWFGLTKDDEAKEHVPVQTNRVEEIELREKVQTDAVVIQGSRSNGNVRRSQETVVRSGVAMARRIEFFAVPVYLLLFVIFQLIYWPWLLSSSGFFDWTIDSTYNVPD